MSCKIWQVGCLIGIVLTFGMTTRGDPPETLPPIKPESLGNPPAKSQSLPEAPPAYGSPGKQPEKAPPATLPAPSSVQPPALSGPRVFGMAELTGIALEQNPRLSQATFAIETARGEATQAGLYPNPSIAFIFDELGDRQGPAGINTLPLITQEIVLGGKLRLSQAAAMKNVDQVTLNLMSRRYALIGEVRVAYLDVLGLQQRVELLHQLAQLAEVSVNTTKKLLEAKEASRLDLVQLEVELERVRADLSAAERELPAAQRRLAAIVGVPYLPIKGLAGTLYLPLPVYNLDKVLDHVLKYHPDIHAAQVAIDRAHINVQRQVVEPIPNLTLSAGYVRQNQNRSNDATIGISLPVPLWNKNQGNIAAAKGQLGEAYQRVGQVENELADRVAQAHRDYSSARMRVERYRDVILPKARETYELSLKAYQGGAFEYLRVVEAQRSMANAALEYNRASQDAWKAAAQMSGLAMEEVWPPPLPPAKATPKNEELPPPRKDAPEKNGEKEKQPEELPFPRRER